MTISSSLNAGVSGLNANAMRLAGISDNIANSATYGYKRVVTEFGSMVTGGGGAYSAGGVQSNAVRMVDGKSTLISTSNPTDLAVTGKGFIPVGDRATIGSGEDPQMMLTTTGSFRTDEEGYLVTQSGQVLLGWPAASDGTIPSYPRDSGSGLEPIQINSNSFSADPTTSMDLAVNLPASDTQFGASGDTRSISVEYFDNLGSSETLTVEFTPVVPATDGQSNEWTMTVYDSATGTAVLGEYTLTFNDSRTDGGTLASVTTVSGGAYDAATGEIVVNVAGGPMAIGIGMLNDPEGMSQLGDAFAPVEISKDGSPLGNMISVEVDENGYVHALFDTGVSRTIYQVPMVDLPNPNGMVALDYQTYLPSYESGPYFLWDAGSGPTGTIVSYAREESATDVAGELTDMIKTQRAYSSNAKVITTVDEMLQETTNIKR